MATTKTAKTASTATKKVPSAPIPDVLREARQAIARARAARADDIDFRDAGMSFTLDLWKATVTALRVMRTSPDAGSIEVIQAINWTEFRQEELAREILGATPESDEGRNIREAVLVESLMDIIAHLDWSEIDMLPAIAHVLEVRRNELGMAPAADKTKAVRKEPREAELMRAIRTIGDILIGDGTGAGAEQESIIAALRIVDQAEGMQSA